MHFCTRHFSLILIIPTAILVLLQDSALAADTHPSEYVVTERTIISGSNGWDFITLDQPQ